MLLLYLFLADFIIDICDSLRDSDHVFRTDRLLRAICRISCAISSAVLGRPGLRTALPSYLLAISFRYHRIKVSGVTTVSISKSPCRPINFALEARRRR